MLKRSLIVAAALSVAATTAAATVAAATTGPVRASATDTTIEHWGSFNGGCSDTDDQVTPTPLNVPGKVIQVSSSNDAQYALLANGSVYAWGQGCHGELGDGKMVGAFKVAQKVQFPPGVKIAYLPTDVMPYDSAFAVATTGRVWGWGLDAQSEFCTGADTESDTPFELPATLSGVTTLAGALNHATYDAGGTLYSCGGNNDGALGDGSTASSKTPVKVSVLDGADVTALVASFGDTGALLKNGDYYDWGENNNGQVGDGTTANAYVPVQVTLPAAVTQAAQGGSLTSNGQTQVLLSSGALYAWGTDSVYQLGDGKTTNEDSPELITPPARVTYQTLCSGGSTGYAITAGGDVYAWGGNGAGQVGNGTKVNEPTPTLVESGQGLISATAADVVTAPPA
jgi:alpha-tubulin suppressor-like RCC1 family protein